MVQKIIGLGVPDKGNGDPLRTAFSKVNDNFAELYNSVSAVVVVGATAPINPSVGDLWWNSESGRMYVYYGTAWVDASPVDGAGISSTNQLVNGAYTTSLGANGVLTLPDGSIINGSTIRGVAGTGELNYTGITIGPNSNDAEKTWMWVDHANAYISTNNAANTWTFNNNGGLTFPQGTFLGYSDPGGFIIDGAVDKDIAIYTYSGADAHGWTFGNNGSLTLPASGDVVDSTSVSQLAKRAEGSWTVTAGTSTYSFTVPADGTYTMWVKGNIPNGIIIWNATLSISNTNVPAIGTQYAWNYTGGGSPILLTAIPDQIRGVAGTISTDATYAGITSNRFDFGISNTSGSSQTIYYGYTKV